MEEGWLQYPAPVSGRGADSSAESSLSSALPLSPFDHGFQQTNMEQQQQRALSSDRGRGHPHPRRSFHPYHSPAGAGRPPHQRSHSLPHPHLQLYHSTPQPTLHLSQQESPAPPPQLQIPSGLPFQPYGESPSNLEPSTSFHFSEQHSLPTYPSSHIDLYSFPATSVPYYTSREPVGLPGPASGENEHMIALRSSSWDLAFQHPGPPALAFRSTTDDPPLENHVKHSTAPDFVLPGNPKRPSPPSPPSHPSSFRAPWTAAPLHQQQQVKQSPTASYVPAGQVKETRPLYQSLPFRAIASSIPHPAFAATASSSTTTPLIATAASLRERRAAIPVDQLPPLSLNLNRAWAPPIQTIELYERRSASTKPKVDMDCPCSVCGTLIARLILRGDTDAEPFHLQYFCRDCAPPNSLLGEIVLKNDEERDGVYADSLSAAVDRSQGLAIAPPDSRPPARKERTTPQIIRQVGEDTVICDVCARAIGSGGIIPRLPHTELKFGVEVICLTCEHRYRRCSDCGGGGGQRLGVGKWRCWQIFPEGRKTCQLSHLRLGNVDEMRNDIWAIADIPTAELELFLPLAREAYFRHTYSTLAVPEILETEEAMVKTSEEVERTALDLWSVVEPLLKEDADASLGRRRYLASRWSLPTHRKRKVRSDSSRAATMEENGIIFGHPAPRSEPEENTVLVRDGMNLAGFVVCEMDFLTGTLLIILTTPWATGDTFDATTIMMQKLLFRIRQDICELNADRQQAGESPLPKLEKAWQMTPFQKEGKLVGHLLNRRGYLRFERYLSKYPDTDETHFYPHRQIYLPSEFLKGWHILVRKIDDDDDWNARVPPVKKRTRKRAAAAPAATGSGMSTPTSVGGDE
ncbi:hypothetical protein T439DRAFT_375755 [Meredithblackwellia eburnea MCA 4105]